MRRATSALCVLAIAGTGCGSSDPEPPPGRETRAAVRELSGAAGGLGAHYRQANRLLGGGADAFRARLRRLRGHPVVVNKWASWCGPCRAEFPFFQSQARKRGREVAFLGVNSQDNRGDARKFMAKFPVPYPSFEDPKLEVAAVFEAVQAFPATAFYERNGELAFVHQGAYPTEGKLREDIDRYAR